MNVSTGAEKYDVAISFVSAKDLAVAKALSELLEPELTTFVFTDRQEDVGGGDGMTAYARVFKHETRLAVILLRPQWGKTPWTGVEEAAIKERALKTGFRSFMIVAMEEGTELPEWIPAWCIYQHGWREPLAQTAAVIRARARDVGAVLKVETVADAVRRRAAHDRLLAERAAFLASPAGADAARGEVERLYAEITRLSAELNEADPRLALSPMLSSDNVFRVGCAINGQRRALVLWWITESFYSLRGSNLQVCCALKYPMRESWSLFDFALNEEGAPGWLFRGHLDGPSGERTSPPGPPVLTPGVEPTRSLAERALLLLTDAIHSDLSSS